MVSDHAKDRIVERKVTDNDIRQTFLSPGITSPHTSENTTNYEKTINGVDIKIGVVLKENGKHILKTVISEDTEA